MDDLLAKGSRTARYEYVKASNEHIYLILLIEWFKNLKFYRSINEIINSWPQSFKNFLS